MEGGQILGRRAAAADRRAVVLILLVVVAKTLGDEGDTRRSIWAETEGSPRTIFIVLTFAYFFGTELVWATDGRQARHEAARRRPRRRQLGAGPALIRNIVRFVDACPASTSSARSRSTPPAQDSAARRHRRQDERRRRGQPPPHRPTAERPDDDDVLAQILALTGRPAPADVRAARCGTSRSVPRPPTARIRSGAPSPRHRSGTSRCGAR